MVRVVVIRDLTGARDPGAAVAGDVPQHLGERSDPMRLTDQIGVQRDAHHRSRLLAFARQKPLEPVVLDVNEVVIGMSDLLERTLGEKIRIRTVLEPGAWNIEADPTELEAAILNLAVNARDAMPEGGRLGLSATIADREVVVTVRDSGVGITTENLARIFEPLYSTKAKGIGLGLSIAHEILGRHHGTLTVQSEPGAGSAFTVRLPRAS